jgi:hypothetical protein
MATEIRFPFRAGSLLKEAPWNDDAIEWRDKEEFDATLTIEKISSTTATWKDAYSGRTFPMFLSDLKDVLVKGLVAGGTVTARWTLAKRGYKYGILLAETPKRRRFHHYQVRGVYPNFKYGDWVATDVREISDEELSSIRRGVPNFWEHFGDSDFPPPAFNGDTSEKIVVDDRWGRSHTEQGYKPYAATWHRNHS